MSSVNPNIRTHSDCWLSLGSYEDVLNSDFDYWSVRKELLHSGMEMIRILRIHNRNLRDRFDQEIEHFKKTKPPGFSENIEFLYHGTKAPLDKICAEGLDERESPEGHFGRGIYFSDRPEMCRAYCEDAQTATSEHFIVRCQVILGQPKVYEPGIYDVGLMREPVKSDIGGKKLYYDSVQGQVGAFKQYVVYERRRVNIQYIVYYKSTQPTPVLPTVPALPGRAVGSSHQPGALKRPLTPPNEEGRSPSDDERPPSGASEDELCRSRSSSVSSLGGASSQLQSAVGGTVAPSVGGATEAFSPLDGASSHLEGAVDGAVAPSVGVTTKVSVIRKRTQRLTDQAGSAIVDGNTDVSGGVVKQTQDTSTAETAAYRQAIQENAIQKLFELKGQVPDSKLEELMASYTMTYGHPGQQLTGISASTMQTAAASGTSARSAATGPTVNSGLTSTGPHATAPSASTGLTASASSRPGLSAGLVEDDIEDVMSNLLLEFEQFLPGVNQQVARQYIHLYQMDLQMAIGAYLDDNN